jgi:resuscitation-promoting factor RpfB
MIHKFKRYRLLAHRRAIKFEKQVHHHPYVLFLLIASFVTVFSVVLFYMLSSHTVQGSSDAKIVILYADHKTETLPTRELTVGEFLNKAGLSIHDGDVVEPSLITKIQEDNFRINVYRASPVVVIDGTQSVYGFSAALTPRSLAEQTGAKLYPEDIVYSEPSDDFLKERSIGNKVIIDRATPASLNLYGSSLAVRTHAKTVGNLLIEKKVVLAKDDTVLPGIDTLLTTSTQVFVTRKGTQVVTSTEEIPAPSQTVEDNSLSFGTTAIRQAGSPGKKSVTYQIQLVNGVEVSRTLIQTATVQEPVPQVIARGQAVQIPSDKEGLMRSAGIADSDFPYVYYIINHENASWCPTRYQGTTGCPAYYVEKFPGAETDTNTGYGLCQSTPGIKMATAGEDWRTNAVTQLRWCASYAQRRHGGWYGAYNYWISHNNW